MGVCLALWECVCTRACEHVHACACGGMGDPVHGACTLGGAKVSICAGGDLFVPLSLFFLNLRVPLSDHSSHGVELSPSVIRESRVQGPSPS